jgi:itaconate CoA-transferase
MTGALDGILVLALEQAVAAPYTSSRLADAGARVIKIERPEGDFARGYDKLANGECTFFVWLNRGKQSLVADIKDDGDGDLMHRILAKADVYIQNLAPGAAARAGFGSSELRERYPRLVTCDISGYGEDGPYRENKAYDLLVQAESGVAAVTGGPEAPGRVGISICDITCGVQSYAAILKALYQRERTGNGSGIAVSLFDSMADWMTPPILQAQYGGKPPPRIGFNHPIIAPYGAYEAQGREAIVIAIQNDREWARFCTGVLRRPELAAEKAFASNVDRVANRAEMDAIIVKVFGSLSRSALAERLATAQIAYGALNSVDDVIHHPQLRRTPVITPSGPIDLVAPPARTTGEDLALDPVPAIGEHSDAIRAEFAP